MMKPPPKVSVITSIYNGEDHLKEAINSILNQTFKDFEFIIINDGSSDGSWDILCSYKDGRIRLYNNLRNEGLTKCLNKGIVMAKGQYIARMDVDDISMPTRLEKQVNFLDENPEYGVVGTRAIVVSADGKKSLITRNPCSDWEIRRELIKHNVFIHSSVMVRREVFESVGLYNPSWKYAQDYELWFRIAKDFKLANIPEPLIIHRQRDLRSIHSSRKIKAVGRFAIKARLRAIKLGLYPGYSYVYILKPLVLQFIPCGLKVVWNKLANKEATIRAL